VIVEVCTMDMNQGQCMKNYRFVLTLARQLHPAKWRIGWNSFSLPAFSFYKIYKESLPSRIATASLSHFKTVLFLTLQLAKWIILLQRMRDDWHTNTHLTHETWLHAHW
jgi:hypothetical protein